MTVIGIDQSLTGFAAVALDDTAIHMLRITPKQRGVRRLMEIRCEFRLWLDQIPSDIEHICMEGYANGAKFGREGMGEIGGLTKVVLAEHFGLADRVGFPTFVQPLQVKMFAGDTKAKKDDLKLLVYKKWGATLYDDNLCDAYILAKIAKAMVVEPELVYEKTVISKLQDKNEWELSSKSVQKRISLSALPTGSS